MQEIKAFTKLRNSSCEGIQLVGSSHFEKKTF